MFAPRPARGKSVVVAVVAAMILHLMAFGAMVGGAVLNILTEEQEVEIISNAPVDIVKNVLVELDALELMAMRESLGQINRSPEDVDQVAEVPPLREPAKNDSKRFMETSRGQESETAPEDAVLIGERNTEAASDLAATQTEGPEVPTQIGREIERDERSLTESDFSPGEVEGQAVREEPRQETSVSAASRREGQTPALETAPHPGERDAVEVPVEKNPNTQNQEDEGHPQRSEIVGEAEGAEERLKESAEESVKDSGAQEGFRTESRKTRMEGTISRRGQSSLKVEATALGKYKAQVNRIIETEWQRRCVMHRDHVLPGILTLRFYVDKTGRVSGLRYLDVFQASTMQKGFTMRAVQQPRLPSMPEEVVKELDGEPLEFHINFHF
ncbi:MAG: hypothetical protein P8M65_07785 [Roseibacillus sp.]|nr:hypothetical protein [Roseibacillus sp.]